MFFRSQFAFAQAEIQGMVSAWSVLGGTPFPVNAAPSAMIYQLSFAFIKWTLLNSLCPRPGSRPTGDATDGMARVTAPDTPGADLVILY